MHFSRLPQVFRGSRAVLAALYLILAIIAQFLPLVGDLHYEFSAVMAVAASLLTGIIMAMLPRSHAPATARSQVSDADPGTPAVAPSHAGTVLMDGATLWSMIRQAVLLSLLPLPVALLGAVISDGCGIAEGIAWYLTLAPAAAAISAVLAGLARLIFRKGWMRLCLFLLLWSASLFRGAFEGLTGPHIFLYSWQVGFFPGGSWDMELPITPLLLLYRAAHVLIAGLLALVIVELAARRHPPLPTGSRVLPALGMLVAVGAIVLVAHRPELGLTRTDTWLRAELGDSLRTQFAVIYYHAPSTDSLDLWQAANLTDFHISELAAALGMGKNGIEPITLYLYSSSQEEKRLVGTSSAAFTKPWARKLNMSFAGIDGTLRHELAHVMLAPHGNQLGISISQGLLEGSAMALENDYLWRTLHEYARAMYAFDLAPPVESIMSVGGFSSRRASVSYVLAGSFSRWLIERYGMPRYLKAFPWGDFEGAYGRSLHQLSDEYRTFIDSLPAPPRSQEPAMRHLFGGGSFFFQKCLRRIGSLNGAGYDALGEERYAMALERFRSSLAEGINYGARAGVLRALAGLGRYREMLDSSAVYAHDTASYPLLPYLIEQGDAHWALGDTAGARHLYDSALALDVSRSLSLRAAIRLHFLRGDSAAETIMRTYFTRPMKLLQRLALLARAEAAADDPTTGLVIAMMRSSLTASELPLTSIDWLIFTTRRLPVADTAYTPEGNLDPLDRFILSSLADGLRPAMQYAGLHGTDVANEPVLDALLRLQPQGFVPGSENYMREGREMEERFERYVGGE